jgi:hypothetical protein
MKNTNENVDVSRRPEKALLRRQVMAFARNVVVDVLLVFCRYLNPIRSVKLSGAAYSGYVHTTPDEFVTASVHIRPILQFVRGIIRICAVRKFVYSQFREKKSLFVLLYA